MSSSVLTYDPRKVIVVFGYARITGFAEDDMVKIKPGGEGMQTYVGADGEVGRSIDPNHTFEVTINLASTSKSNNLFTLAYNNDRANGGGNGLGAIAPILGDALKNLMLIDGDVMEHVLRLVLDENYISVSTNGSKNNLAYLTEEKVNEVFEGKPIDMIMLAVEVVKVNYLDFTMLSSVPTGFLKTLGMMKSAFQESLQTNSKTSSLSTE